MVPICRKTQSLLSMQYQQQTLPHAIIIQGIEGTGKEILATWLIDLLVCQSPVLKNVQEDELTLLHACEDCKACLLRKSNTYPDHLLLTSENKSIGVDDVRLGNTFLEKTAQLGHLKTILIPKAQLMTVAGANALLKTLEEPSENSYIVLLTDDLETLLPTIISRCAVYVIRPSVGEALITQLRQQVDNKSLSLGADNKTTNSNAFVNISQLAELTDEKIMADFIAFQQHFIHFLNNNLNEEPLLIQLIESKHSFRWLEQIVSNLMRNSYIHDELDKNTSIQVRTDLSPSVLYVIYQTIINSNKLIKSYAQTNRQFVAEQLVMKMSDILTPSI